MDVKNEQKDSIDDCRYWRGISCVFFYGKL